MRSKFKWIFTLLVALTMQFSFAQEKTITGVVSDATGPLPGVNVVIKGTTKGSATDFNGQYSIKAKQGDVLVFSFLGLKDVSLTVGSSNILNVKLKDSDAVELKDVVVLGYDKVSTKAKSASASTTVSSETFRNRPNVTLLQSLQGAAPGLTVSTSSGSPGSAKIDLLVRGVGSINSSTEPLYVIDGLSTNSVVFRNINPEDIESASILRDASATSIYGNSGANGVIVIKTKGGKFNSKLKFNFSTSTSFSYLPDDKYNLANSQQVLQIERSHGVGAGAGLNPYILNGSGTPMTDDQIAGYASTDWKKVYFNMGISKTYNMSMSSGSKNLANYTSLSYLNDNGIVPTTDFQRFTLRTNLTGKSDNDKFSYGTNLTIAYSRRHQLAQETSTTINNNTVQNPLLGALTALPYLNDTMYPGTGQGLYDKIGTSFTNGETAFVLQDILQQGNIPNRINEIKILGNANVGYKFTNNFSFNTKFGIDYTVADRTFARAPWSYLAIAVRESGSLPYGGLELQSTDRDYGFNVVSNFKYTKTYNKHLFDFGIYTEYKRAVRSFGQFQQNGLDLKTYAFGAGTGWTSVGANFPALRPSAAGFQALAGSFSYFGTFNYEYDERFGLDAVFRRDASYRFVDDNKWGTFWSVGGRWNIDKENFMANSIFSMLKVRGSYGTQGNQNIQQPAPGGNPIFLANNLTRDLTVTGIGYGDSSAYLLGTLGNNTLQWEEQKMSNIGVDFEVFKSRFTGNIDIYNRRTDKLFNFINLSAIVGYGTSMEGNSGSLNNKGIELALRYKILKDFHSFNLSVFANGSYNKNEIIDIQRTVNGGSINEVGSKVDEYYMVPYLGVNPNNGNLLFQDINNNVTENPTDTDRRRTGKNATPEYQGGFGLNADYKGFFIDTQFSWVKNVWRLDNALIWLSTPSYAGQNNVTADLLNSWTTTNTNTDIPSLDATNFNSGGTFSDMWIKDASYLRLKNISFGYSVNKKFLEKTPFTAVKLYAQGENLYTWTKWRGFDADSGENTNLGRFPSPRIFSFGLNVEF